MFQSQILRQTARAAHSSTVRSTAAVRVAAQTATRQSLHTTANLRKEKQPSGTTAADSPKHEGTFARTDASVQVDYPDDEHHLPPSKHIQGRGGVHFKRTLPSFSLEGKVGVITGGARGLGLVMTQAFVISGADVAIVDLNSEFDCTMRGTL